MMDSKIALFDLDDTLADYMGQLNSDLATKNNGRLTSEQIARETHLIKNQVGWWENLPPINSGIELMKLCSKIGFQIGISTQGPYKNRHGWGEKFNWCDRYVALVDPNYVLIMTRNGKGLVYGRVFADDYPPYMLEWLENRPRGLGLMPRREWNKDFEHPRVVKYDPDNLSFDAGLISRLQAAFSRDAGKSVD